MIKYVAFLRGINMIGHKPVKMEALQKAFEAIEPIRQFDEVIG